MPSVRDRRSSHPGSPLGRGPGVGGVGSVFAVTKEKYAPKASVSPARSSSPFSADAFEGRPMTPWTRYSRPFRG